mmetsp:Transcript_25515/g.59459  ORF Transcript_25515/g.59459 Transcript_25515/m.59459 type:complete len:212 (+) Transcript_25515:7216-7851(+)
MQPLFTIGPNLGRSYLEPEQALDDVAQANAVAHDQEQQNEPAKADIVDGLDDNVAARNASHQVRHQVRVHVRVGSLGDLEGVPDLASLAEGAFGLVAAQVVAPGRFVSVPKLAWVGHVDSLAIQRMRALVYVLAGRREAIVVGPYRERGQVKDFVDGRVRRHVAINPVEACAVAHGEVRRIGPTQVAAAHALVAIPVVLVHAHCAIRSTLE